MSSTVYYSVNLEQAAAQRFAVTCRYQPPNDGPCEFRIPAWIRGSYLIRDLARHVMDFSAQRGGEPVAFSRKDKSTVEIAPGSGEIELHYRVHASDASVRKAYLDQDRGFFNGSSLFYCPVSSPAPSEFRMRIDPAGGAQANWQLATSMRQAKVDAAGFGEYLAESYEELIDHPVELGAFERHDFEVDGIPHALVLSAGVDCDTRRMIDDIARICQTQREFFGGEPELDQYLFLTNVVSAGYGGLEHRSSCALICSHGDLPRIDQPKQSTEYRGFLGLCSHEYFHLWNVKRITPRSFADSELGREAYSCDLWHYEGVTSYYDDLFLLRSACIDAPTYLDLLAGQASRVERAPANRRQSLTEASFETWIKFYQPDDNSLNAAANYYSKGALVALCLDLELRLNSETSLDQVMQALWQRNGSSGTPVEEGGLEALASEVSGLDLKPFFDLALRSTEALPLERLLAEFGVQALRRASTSLIDPGGRTVLPAPTVWAGVRFKPGSLTVSHVLENGPAQRAGLIAGDEFVALAGQQLSAQKWLKLMEQLKPGDHELHFFRDGRMRQLRLALIAPPLDSWTITLAEVEGAVAQRRLAWLGV